MSKDELYCKTTLSKLLQPMVSAVWRDTPKDPILFMIQLLQNYSGMKSLGDTIEHAEWENLRKEIKYYKKKYEKEDKEIFVSSDIEEQDKEEQSKFDIQIQKQMQKKRRFRTAVSAEVYGDYNKKWIFAPNKVPKTDEQKKIIIEKCKESFLFSSLEDTELETILWGFEKKSFKSGDIIIKQGNGGDFAYLVDSGEWDCERILKAGDPPTFLKTYRSGDSFGELALLYNSPSASTIKAKTNVCCWTLDRHFYNNIIKEAEMKKWENYESMLRQVELFSTITDEELQQICFVLKPEKVSRGTWIVAQNKEGDKFYMLEEGSVYAKKESDPGKPQNQPDFNIGKHFCELALLKNEKRDTSIYAETDCKLLTIDRMSFKRWLGPLELLLQRDPEVFMKYIKK